jgi:hypothetical protein
MTQSTELVREAMRDGRRIALLRCYDDPDAGGTVVEAEIHPTNDQAPVSHDYRFKTAPEAFRFVQEALLALQYLGCNVA